MIKVGIIGGTGYTGIGLVGLLLRHPEADIEWVTSETHKGKKLSDVYPHLTGLTDIVCQQPDIKSLVKTVDIVFSCLPHGKVLEVAGDIIAAGKKLIDLSADFRLKDVNVFEDWYKVKHKSPELLKEAVYGLPELNKITGAKIVANPGCYATASILGAAPILHEKIHEGEIIIDAKSGISGAGKTLTQETHYPECNEGISAYNVSKHRHMPEIEQELGNAAKGKVSIVFTPHLTPMTRGILATIYIKLKKDADKEKLTKLYEDFYKGKKFIRVLKDKLPSTKYVCGTNYCDIAVEVDERSKMAIVISAIDNLIKGASGQAVQNMNLLLGLPEDVGLGDVPLYP